jgi:hypothetical protein
MENEKNVNWEQVGVYIAVAAAFLTVIIYIADMKERIRASEVKIEKLEQKK